MKRYSRQILFRPLGEAGQKKLLASRVTIIGCGAIGSMSAELLARAGIGSLKIVDRDFVELDNLQRQHLFDEADALAAAPKAEAARRRLQAVNSEAKIEGVVADVTSANVENLLADVMVDGTDNFETRLVLNDACVKAGVPWVYGGAVGSHGMVLGIAPGKTACFRCFLDRPPDPGQAETCDTAGILGSASSVVGAMQAAETIRILAGGDPRSTLVTIDVWEGRFSSFQIPRNPDCPACVRHDWQYLKSRQTGLAVKLCGRQAVQVSPPEGRTADFDAVTRKLAGVAKVSRSPYMLRFEAEGLRITLFPDARAIVSGTEDEARARTLYARYVGS